MRKHWQDWGNLVLGLWIFVSPWVFQFATATGAEAASAAASSAGVWKSLV